MEGPEELHLPNLIEIAVKTRSYSNIIINYKLRLLKDNNPLKQQFQGEFQFSRQ